jgi:hypothetical protein
MQIASGNREPVTVHRILMSGGTNVLYPPLGVIGLCVFNGVVNGRGGPIPAKALEVLAHAETENDLARTLK